MIQITGDRTASNCPRAVCRRTRANRARTLAQQAGRHADAVAHLIFVYCSVYCSIEQAYELPDSSSQRIESMSRRYKHTNPQKLLFEPVCDSPTHEPNAVGCVRKYAPLGAANSPIRALTSVLSVAARCAVAPTAPSRRRACMPQSPSTISIPALQWAGRTIRTPRRGNKGVPKHSYVPTLNCAGVRVA